jgi:hypothetical protein
LQSKKFKEYLAEEEEKKEAITNCVSARMPQLNVIEQK